MNTLPTGSRRLPGWWLQLTDACPALATVVAVAGLVTIMFLLAPAVTRPSERGGMIDSLAAIVRSDVLAEKAVSVRTAYHHWVPEEVRNYAQDIFFNPALYFIVPFVLLLEFLFPCNPAQPLVGKGFLQDSVWFVASAPTKILVLGVVAEFLRRFYDGHLAFLTLSAATAWPLYLQMLAALVVGEFLNWGSHVARHQVRSLWLFHAVHHSQTEMNVFTEDRNHFVDRVVSSVLMFLPFYMFQVPNLYAVAVIGLWISIHSRFVHANVKTNLGWLGWVISSPQFHRIHHSADPAHWDKNYGGILSIFDHLFGTAHPSSNIYPETGIADRQFPAEAALRLSQLPRNWFAQTTYPFEQLLEHRPVSRLLGLFGRRLGSRIGTRD